MYTEEQFDKLEQDERLLTDLAIATMLMSLTTTKLRLEKELRDFYQRYGKDGVVTYSEVRKLVSEQDHRKRLAVLLLFISDEFDALLESISPQFKTMLEDVVDKEATFFDVDLDAYDFTEEDWGADESTWLERLADDVAIWSVYIATDLKQAFSQRRHIDDVLKRLDKRFESMGYVLDKLGLTESTAIGSMARRRAFKELGIDKYQFYTRADERTCEVCGSMHGLIFPMSAYEVGVTASPLHPRCRCWEIPIWD